MAALMFQVPSETARILHEIPVPGNPELHDPHITVMYLGKDVAVEAIGEMLPVIFDVTSTTAPFSVKTSHISNFPAGNEGVPVIARIESPALHEFRQRLADAFDENDLFFDKKFPDYKPHTTLAWDPNEDTTVDIDIPEVSWGAHELLLWGSNRGTGRLVIKFPLSLPQGKVAGIKDNSHRDRAIVQLANWARKDSFV